MENNCWERPIDEKAFRKASNRLRNIVTLRDLHRYFNSLLEYKLASEMLRLYPFLGKQVTCIKAVAAFFEKCGFDVSYDGIYYIIK